MLYAIKELMDQLKAARKNKGMSQRAFARAIGMPQSRLSKIENGRIDPRTSSLLELARLLDLELMLIPRQAVPAVSTLVRQITRPSHETGETAMYDLDNLEPNEEEPDEKDND